MGVMSGPRKIKRQSNCIYARLRHRLAKSVYNPARPAGQSLRARASLLVPRNVCPAPVRPKGLPKARAEPDQKQINRQSG